MMGGNSFSVDLYPTRRQEPDRMEHNTPEEARQRLISDPAPDTIWVLGAGQFGALAIKRLSRRYPRASFLVVDTCDERLDEIRRKFGAAVRKENGVRFIARNRIPDDVWVIPAIPVHVAFQWILAELDLMGKAETIPVPMEIDHQVPNAYRSPDGAIYGSFATFRCPDACNEPDDICTYTKEPRLGNLFELFSQIDCSPAEMIVVRSLQMAPGVGGYTGLHLRNALRTIRRQPGMYLIATSCRCHGVINALNWATNS
jgi:hypothetical protein